MASCLSLIGVTTRFFALFRLAVDATLLRRDALFDVWTVSGDTLFSDALLERGDLLGDFSTLGDIFSKI